LLTLSKVRGSGRGSESQAGAAPRVGGPAPPTPGSFETPSPGGVLPDSMAISSKREARTHAVSRCYRDCGATLWRICGDSVTKPIHPGPVAAVDLGSTTFSTGIAPARAG